MSKPAPITNATNPTRHDLEINAVLNRLHSGCRFIDFDELSEGDGGRNSSSSGGGGGNNHKIDGVSGSRSSSDKNAYNLLRNASSPDEIHAELGRGLAHSYIESLLHSITSSSKANLSNVYDINDGHVVDQAAVERGERILRSLCCGEEASSTNRDGGSGRQGSQSSSTRMNYASTAHAYFHSLLSYCSNDKMEKSNTVAIAAFLRKQWQKWCVQCEEIVLQTRCDHGGGVHVLNACLKCYSYMCFLHHGASDDKIYDGNGIARVYEMLMHQSSRKYLILTSVGRAFHIMKKQLTDDAGVTSADCLVDMVSPLFSSCVLAARKSNERFEHYHAERRILLQEILKGCSIYLLHDRSATTVSQIANMVRYLTTSLIPYLTQSVHATFSKECSHLVDIFELSYDWLRGICDIIQGILALAKDNTGGIVIHATSSSMEQIVTVLLPQFTTTMEFADTSIMLDMAPIYSTIHNCINCLPQNNRLPIANATVALRLGTLTLTSQEDAEVSLMIDMLLSIMKCLENSDDISSNELFIGGLSTALGCIFRCRPACFDVATRLYKLGESLLHRASCREDRGKELTDETFGLHLMDILRSSLDEGQDFLKMLDIVTASEIGPLTASFISSWQRRPLMLPDQCAGLLVGLSLLHVSVKSLEASMIEPGHAFTFLRLLLDTYPRLASRVVPSVIDAVRTCLARRSSAPMTETLLDSLKFLSTKCIVSDAHGAHLAWTFLSSLVTEEMPPTVRSAVIRLLPGMCSSNKRLFRRVIDVIGKSMLSQDPIIRVAATSALSEMANLDLIRDVEKVVGLIQSRLIDEEPAVLYYALEVLRHLVVNEELEFDLVVRVLEKRLSIDLSNVNTIMSKDMLALEELMSLMGQGDLDEDEDDDSDDNDKTSGRGEIGSTVSQQTIRAVTLLVELALLPQLSIKNGIGQDNEVEYLAKLRVQRAIYCSLAGYSADILGLDSESIRSWDGMSPLAEESNDMSSELMRYLNLKDIALNGLDFASKLFVKQILIDGDDEVVQDLLDSAATIGKTLLQFEQEVHGSFLFRSGQSSGRGSDQMSSHGKAEKSRVPKSVLSSLPTASSIQENFQSDPRSATAVGMLYSICFSDDTSSASLEIEGILLKISECLGDVLNEQFEPLFHTMQICSLIHSMSTIWKYIQCAGDSVKDELLSLVLAQLDEWSEIYGDTAYVTQAAFFLAVDDSSHQNSPGLVRVQQAIVDSDSNYLFQSEDTKGLCLGMIAARLCRDLDSRVTEIINSIERSLTHSRQNSFGGLFGLSMIMTNLSGNENDTDSSAAWRRQHAQRVLCILLSTLNTCLAQECDVVNKLRSSIESGSAASDLTQSCTNLESLRIQDGSALKLRSVILAIGSSFPAMRSISSDLLKCVLILVDKVPWGSGKGFVLHAAYKNAIESKVFTHEELSHAISSASDFVQGEGVGIGDALLALASLCRISPDKNQNELEVVAGKCQEILQNNGAQKSGADKQLAILAGCAVVGELPGLALFTPSIHNSARKTFVVSFIKILVDMASNDDIDRKYRDASTIGLGILCAMSSSFHHARGTDSGQKLHSVQTKEGSMMQAILQEVERTYSSLCRSPTHDHANRPACVKKLCALFSTLEPIALPGSFVSVIELTLNVPMSSEEELKASSMKLLVSQLESRRRIGFDGRGFADLATRLAKMAPNDLHALVGTATPMMMTSLPNLIYQLPTGIAEEVVVSLWTICRHEFMEPNQLSSAREFLRGIQTILVAMNDSNVVKHAPRKSLSPSLLRTLRKFIVVEVFSDLCTDAVQITMSESVWTAYLQCLQQIPDAIAEIDSLIDNISQANVLGMSTLSMVSPKSARRVESWISLQNVEESTNNQRLFLLSILNISIQSRNEMDVKESILSQFEVMLVKGIDTMSIYIVAAKVAFWWDNRAMHQLQIVDMPIQRVSNLSSFYVNGKLAVGAKTLTPKMLSIIFDAFIADLPPKLAVLCQMWKISDDVCNRASRILKATAPKVASEIKATHHTACAISCMKDIVHLLSGGEVLHNE